MRKRILIAVGLILLIPVALLLVFLYTPVGVSLVAGQLNRLERIGIHIEGVSGTFAGLIVVRRFELDHPRVHVLAHDIVIDPQLRGLLLQTLRTRSVTVHDVEVQIRAAELPPPDRPPRFLPPYLRLDARGVRLNRVRYVHVDGRTIDADTVSGRVTMTSRQLRARGFEVAAPRFDASGDLRLVAGRPVGLELSTQGSVLLQPDLRVHLSASLAGTADELKIRAEVREPSRIVADGLFAREGEEWNITGNLSAASFSLEPWLDQPPFSFGDVALKVRVDREAIRAAGVFSVPEFELEHVSVDARGNFKDRVLQVESSDFTLAGSPVQIHTQGALRFEGGPPHLDLTARWTDLQWPLRDTAIVDSAQGELSLRGSLPYDFVVNGNVNGPHIPTARGTATGVLSKENVTIAHYELDTFGGSLSGAATLQFALPRAWSLTANAKNIASGELHKEFPGSISFLAQGTGTGVNAEADFKMALSNVRGTIRGENLSASAGIERTGTRWRVRDAQLTLGDARLELDGTLQDTIDARWTLHAPSLDRLLPQAHGSIDFKGTASGKTATPHITASIQGSDLRYQNLVASTLVVDADIDASNTQASRLSIFAQQAGYGTQLVESLRASGEGTALDHRIGVSVVGTAADTAAAPRAQMQVNGRFEDEIWRASITTTQFSRGSPPQEIKIEAPANVLLSRQRASLDNFCLIVASGQVCAEGQWQRNGPWEGKISGYDIPLASVLPKSAEDVEYAGRVEGSARAYGQPGSVWQGEAGMKISDAAIIYRPRGAEPETLNLGTGGMHLVAQPQSIEVSFGVQAFTDTYLHANARLTRNGSNDLMHLPLSGEVRARAADANLLPLVFREVDHAAGVLVANATIGGTLAQPEINGRIELIDGELDSYRVNFALRDLDLVATLADERLEFRGTGDAGEGQLEVDGRFTWLNGESRGQMRLRGEELLIADLPEYRVTASPDLQFDIEDERIRVQGDVTIPSARVQPARLTGAVRHSEDANYVGEHPAETDGQYVVDSNIRVKMGDDVRIDAFGLQARITGAVATQIRTGESTTGHGELGIAEGRYEAYGQSLEISRGQLLFDNAPLDDPGLDIEARRRIDTITVGLNVRGTLQEPRLTFFSDPSMPQTQIVSYLLVGKSMDTMQAGETAAATSASDTLALQGGGFLASQIGRRIGLEEVGVENYVNSAGEASPALVLGKFLSPRLFISYGISLTESINTLKLRYTISDRWVLRTESGEAQSADLEFMIER